MKRSRIIKTFLGIFGSTVLILAFQNCGKAGFDADMAETTTSSTASEELILKYGSAKAALVNDIPFAFQGGFDTVAYNSCAETQLRSQSAFFSLKAGAYANTGLSLNSAFYSYMRSNFKPTYPATELTHLQLKEYLADSPNNAGSLPAVSIRKPNSLAMVYAQSSSVTLDTDVIPMLGSLTNPLMSESLIQEGSTANFFPFSSGNKNLEATMRFNTSEALQDAYREALSSSAAVMTLAYMPETYTEATDIKTASTESAPTVAYGVGYKMSFAPAIPTSGTSPYYSNPNNTLDTVTEYDLSGASTTKITWDCSRKYKVVLRADSTDASSAGYCPPHTWSELTSASVLAELAIVRRVLPANQWEVNVNYGCVYPTGSTSCYLEEKILNTETTDDTTDYYPIVEYDLTQPCFRANGTNTEPSRCLQYVTICLRP